MSLSTPCYLRMRVCGTSNKKLISKKREVLNLRLVSQDKAFIPEVERMHVKLVQHIIQNGIIVIGEAKKIVLLLWHASW